MPGRTYWDANYAYIGISLHGQFGRHVCFRYRYGRQEAVPYYEPTNPQTPRQQMWRWIFTQAVHHWHSLTDAQRLDYNRRANRRGGLTGFNWAVSEYLNDYTHVLE
jgi:hypothetical protein